MDIVSNMGVSGSSNAVPEIKYPVIYSISDDPQYGDSWYGYTNSGEKIGPTCWDWCGMDIFVTNCVDAGMNSDDAYDLFWQQVRDYSPEEYDELVEPYGGSPYECISDANPGLNELREAYLMTLFSDAPASEDPNAGTQACDGINCATKYGADMCSIGASTESYPYYIDKTGAFEGYWEDQTDVLSVSQLQSIYDTLLSDGDISAGSFNSFDEWLKANVEAGLLSGCLMSDAQRCDMPAEFGGYHDDDDIDYFSEDEVFRVIINDDPAYVEKILDECGCWYDYDGGGRLMVNMCGLNCLEDNGIDYDEI